MTAEYYGGVCMGLGLGVSLAMIYSMWIASVDHRAIVAMMTKHEDWLRERIESQEQPQ